MKLMTSHDLDFHRSSILDRFLIRLEYDLLSGLRHLAKHTKMPVYYRRLMLNYAIF